MWKADKLGYRGNTNYNKAYQGNELVWEKQVGPQNVEIWYTSTDGKIVTPYRTSSLPTIVSNTYVDGKGVIKFARNVTGIGERAFYKCSSLTSVTIPNSVTSIGDWAFYECSGLTSIGIHNSVTSIGSKAFSYCSGLTSVTIPNSITRIMDWTFGHCTSLTSVTIPNSVTSIEGIAFFYCNSLPSIEIPNSVTNIGDWAFFECSSLTSISYTGTIAQWNAISKGYKWNSVVPATVVHCTDGDVPI